MRYLNTNKQFENYKELVNEEYFVDKSMIIKMLNEKISTKSKYICITRPRRFGKSSIADMLGAYYSKAVESKAIFDKLKINVCKSYEENLNKYKEKLQRMLDETNSIAYQIEEIHMMITLK